MSLKYKANNPDGIYFVTLTVVEWADVFTRRDYCKLVCESISYCQQKKKPSAVRLVHHDEPRAPYLFCTQATVCNA